MTTTIIPVKSEPDFSLLVFHIRAQRQWHCNGGLPQATLAELAGRSPHQLHRLEQSHELPAVLVQALAVGSALPLSNRGVNEHSAGHLGRRRCYRTVAGQ